MQKSPSTTPNERTLSFVGRPVAEAEHPKDAAIDYLHRQLGFTAIAKPDLREFKQLSYHGKIGFFFKLAIPGDTEIKSLESLAEPEFTIRSYWDLYDDLQQNKLMELSRLYAERHLV